MLLMFGTAELEQGANLHPAPTRSKPAQAWP